MGLLTKGVQVELEDLIKEIRELKSRVEKLEGKKRSKAFVKPEIWEVQQEFQKKGSLTCNDDGEAFYHFYESKNWMIGKNKMKNWKSAVANWMRGKNCGKGNNKPVLSNLTDTDW